MIKDSDKELPDDYVWIIDEVGYYPVFGSVLPDGRLRIKTAGRLDEAGNGRLSAAGITLRSSCGPRWSGDALIGMEHPYYKEWRPIVENRETILKELRQKQDRERDERRRQTNRDKSSQTD